MENISGHDENALYVIVVLKGGLFGIPADIVNTMTAIAEVTAIPDVPSFVRGVVNLRGSVYPIIDLRKRLGIDSFTEETEKFFQNIEDDHKKWIDELEACVLAKHEFKLATDPHECVFGKWYSSYKPTSLMVKGVLRELEEPHTRFHAIASEVLAKSARGMDKEAREMIAGCRSEELAELLRLFKLLRETHKEEMREIIVVLDEKPRPFAIVVDSVESVETLAENSTESFTDIKMEFTEKELLEKIGQQRKTQRLVNILNTSKLLR